MLNTIIDDRLQELGVTKNYKGYYQLKMAIQLALEDDFRLQAVSKEIYEPVAKQLGCNDYSVERNIPTQTGQPVNTLQYRGTLAYNPSAPR